MSENKFLELIREKGTTPKKLANPRRPYPFSRGRVYVSANSLWAASNFASEHIKIGKKK